MGRVLLSSPMSTSIAIIASLRSSNLLSSSQNVEELGLRVTVVLLILGDIDTVPNTRRLHIRVILHVGVLLVNDSRSDFGLAEAAVQIFPLGEFEVVYPLFR